MIHLSSDINLTNNNIYADERIFLGFLSSYSSFLFDLTPFRVLRKYFSGENIRVRTLKTIKYFEKQSLSDKKEPFFIFSHIYSPHAPYLFDRYGNKVYHGINTNDIKIQAYNYSEQVLFLNKMLDKMVETILNNDKDCIIIIQSDHGIFPVTPQKERYQVLNAFYFSDLDYSLLYEEISLVNTWRVILKKYFHQDFELLDDKKYYSSPHYPYNIREIKF